MRHIYQVSVFLLILIIVSGCEAVGDIFSAGFYTGIFFIVLVVGIIIFLVMKMGKRD